MTVKKIPLCRSKMILNVDSECDETKKQVLPYTAHRNLMNYFPNMETTRQNCWTMHENTKNV